jgi:hypothetical protein
MTIQELMEAAHLDALGLLDEPEQSAFERAFERAPEGVRAQVRAEQARWASSVERWSREEPPAELREKVLSAVRRAMSEEAEVAGSIGLITSSHAGRNRVSATWRAASLGLAAAAVILLGAFMFVSGENQDLSKKLASDGMLGSYAQAFGSSDFRAAMFNESYQRRYFQPAPGTAQTAEAALHFAPGSGRSTLLVDGVTISGTEDLRLCVVDEQNQIVREVTKFRTSSQTHAESLRGFEPEKGSRLALVATALNAPASAGRVLLVVTI